MAAEESPTSAPGARPVLRSHGAAGDALIAEVSSALCTLRALLGHSDAFGSGPTSSPRATLAEVERRLAATELTVVVVGEAHAGKRTLLDAIVGDARLGAARRDIAAITFIRHRASPSYRARFGAGTLEDHARRVPDNTPELTRRIAELERGLAEARAGAASARAEIEAALDGQEADRAAHQRAVAAQRSLGAIDARAEAERTELELAAERAERALVTIEAEVPVALRSEPARWSVWLWMLRAILLLFWRGAWRRFRAASRERDEARERLERERAASSHAARARADADLELGRLQARVDERDGRLADARRALAGCEADAGWLLGEVDAARRQLVERTQERQERFFLDLPTIPRRGALTELNIDYPARHLPPDITLVDVARLMDLSAEEHPDIWRVVQEQADGCIFVSELDRAVSEAAKRFLQRLREVVPHVLLVLTKVDKAFEDATARGGMDPWEQVEQARRIGTRRFARELGRDPGSVLSISVSAQAVLDAGGMESKLAVRFEAEIAKLFQLLRQERALIIGARAAGAIRGLIAELAETEAVAREASRAKLEALEAQRIPEPAAFRREQLALAEPRIEAAVRELVARVSEFARDAFQVVRRLVERRIRGSAGGAEIAQSASLVEREVIDRVSLAREEARRELGALFEQALRRLEGDLLDELRERYQLLHDLRTEPASPLRLELSESEPPPPLGLERDVGSAIARFRRDRWLLGATGAAAGAAAGTAVLPGVGTAVGAAAGSLLALVRTRRALATMTLTALEPVLRRQELALVAEVEASGAAVAAQMRGRLEDALAKAAIRFDRWIQEPIEAERRAISSARQDLAELDRLGARLQQHDRSLVELLARAADESLGLCR